MISEVLLACVMHGYAVAGDDERRQAAAKALAQLQDYTVRVTTERPGHEDEVEILRVRRQPFAVYRRTLPTRRGPGPVVVEESRYIGPERPGYDPVKAAISSTSRRVTFDPKTKLPATVTTTDSRGRVVEVVRYDRWQFDTGLTDEHFEGEMRGVQPDALVHLANCVEARAAVRALGARQTPPG